MEKLSRVAKGNLRTQAAEGGWPKQSSWSRGDLEVKKLPKEDIWVKGNS